MADPQGMVPLSDDEIMAVADDPQMLAKFNSEERRRLSRLRSQQAQTVDQKRAFRQANPAGGDDYSGPDTFAGGATQSAVDTLKRTAKGLPAPLDPRPIFDAAKNYTGPDPSVEHGQQQFGSVVDSIKNLPQTLQTPEGGGAAIGTLAMSLIAPRVMGAVGNQITKFKDAAAEANVARSANDIKLAIPPTQSAPYTPDDYAAARRYLEAEHTTTPIEGIQSFSEAANNAIGTIEKHVESYVQKHGSDLIRTNPREAAEMVLRRSARRDFITLGMRELSDLGLDEPLTLERAEAIRQQLNAENKAIMKRNRYDAATARKADPGFAAREAAVESLRDGIYQQLESRGIPGVAELRQDEGSLIRMRNAAERHIYGGDNSVPGTAPKGRMRRLTGKAVKYGTTAAGAVIGGATGAVGGEALGEDLSSAISSRALKRDELISRAFRKQVAVPPEYPAIPDDPAIRGHLEAGSLTTPPPADPSYVRGVPADVARREVRGALGPAPTITPPPADPSGASVVNAQPVEIVDPVTGEKRVVYMSDR